MLPRQKLAESREFSPTDDVIGGLEQSPQVGNLAEVSVDAVLQNQGLAVGSGSEFLLGKPVLPVPDHTKGRDRKQQTEHGRRYVEHETSAIAFTVLAKNVGNTRADRTHQTPRDTATIVGRKMMHTVLRRIRIND